MTRIVIGGIPILTDSRRELVERAASEIAAWRNGTGPGCRLVFDVNSQGMALYHSDPAFRRALDTADHIHADGGYLIPFSRWLTDTKIKERSATTDMVHDFAARAVQDQLSFYLLGCTEEVNAKATEVLRATYPGLNIVGRRNGFFSPEDEARVVAEISSLRPDVLWVGLGKPKEQDFAVRHRHTLDCGWLVTSGGCFNFLTGAYGRAPQWMQDNSLEWIYRLATNPRKLFWRYLWANPYALWLTLRHTQREEKND
jgi:exopolysaccharide biosynthesis WecB/TagA/CpsF family protein